MVHPHQEFPEVPSRVSDPSQKKELCQGGYCWTLLCQDKVNSVLKSLIRAVSHTQNANLKIMTRHKP